MEKQKDFKGGAPTPQQVKAFGEQTEKVKQSPYVMLTPVFDTNPNHNDAQKTLQNRAMNAGKFPIRPFPSDPYDTTWTIKDDMSRPVTDANGHVIGPAMASLSRPLPFTAEDVQYLKRKRDQEEMVGYEAWKERKFNLNDPATRAWFEKVCPSYFSQREALLEQQIDLASRYAKISLRGPKNEDDQKLAYFIETGRITLPKGPLWDPYSWVLTEAGSSLKDTPENQKTAIENYNRNSYRKGLFNPTRVMIPETGGLMANPYNVADVVGYPKSNFTGILGAPVSTYQNYAAAYGPSAQDRGLLGKRTEINSGARGQAILAENNARIRQASDNLYKGPAGFRPPPPYVPNPVGYQYPI